MTPDLPGQPSPIFNLFCDKARSDVHAKPPQAQFTLCSLVLSFAAWEKRLNPAWLPLSFRELWTATRGCFAESSGQSTPSSPRLLRRFVLQALPQLRCPSLGSPVPAEAEHRLPPAAPSRHLWPRAGQGRQGQHRLCPQHRPGTGTREAAPRHPRPPRLTRGPGQEPGGRSAPRGLSFSPSVTHMKPAPPVTSSRFSNAAGAAGPARPDIVRALRHRPRAASPPRLRVRGTGPRVPGQRRKRLQEAH